MVDQDKYIASIESRRRELEEVKERVSHIISRQEREIKKLRKKERTIQIALSSLIQQQR
jgi:vacuolar-type H+-ATPase subunit E/Vma4